MSIIRRSLEQELFELLGKDRQTDIATTYFGFDGLGGETLKNIGIKLGLTRERVRQIVTPVARRFNKHRPDLPMLDRTIEFVKNRMPAMAEKIEAQLCSEGVTSKLFRLEGVIRAAELFGRRPPFFITMINGKRIVHSATISSMDIAVRTGRRVIASRGVAAIADVVTEVREIDPGAWDVELVELLVSSCDDFHGLDRSTGWFWFSNCANNPVLNRIRKVLSVANPIKLSEVRDAIVRDHRMKDFAPSTRILLELCRQAPGLRFDGNELFADPAISAVEVLTKCEAYVARILSENGGIMTLGELEDVCGIHIKRTTLHQCLANSPIVYRPAICVYHLIGFREKSPAATKHSERPSIAASGLNAKEAANFLGVSHRTVWYHARTGALKGTKVGSLWYFDIRAVRDFRRRFNWLRP